MKVKRKPNRKVEKILNYSVWSYYVLYYTMKVKKEDLQCEISKHIFLWHL